MAHEYAQYHKQLLDEYRGNPLIEALPDIWTEDEVIRKLTRVAPHNDSERGYAPELRYHCIARLSQGYYQPLEQHIDIEVRISRCLRQGYLSRNPLAPAYARTLAEGFEAQTDRRMMTPVVTYSPRISGFTILGVSGIGKSTAVESVLQLYPQVIMHSEYNGKSFQQAQIVWLKLDCPYNGNVRGLCFNFMKAVDDATGTGYFNEYHRSRVSTDSLMVLMQRIAATYCLGILVIDEIQHLDMAGSKSDEMLNFFVTLVNTIGVPVVMIGTPLAMRILQSEFRQARRGSGQGDLLWPVMGKDAIWDVFIESMWPYQWTRHTVPLTPEMNQALYDESQGVTVIAVILYEIVQLEAISSQKETFTPGDIGAAARKRLNFVQPMIRALRSGDNATIEKFGDIAMSLIDTYGTPELPQPPKKASASRPKLADLITAHLQELGVEPEKARVYAEEASKGKDDLAAPSDVLKTAYGLYLRSQAGAPAIEADDEDLRNKIQAQ